MTESTHKVEVVPVSLEKHPNADALSIVKVYGYAVIVRTEDWKDTPIGAYIPPDSVVPDLPYYKFLAAGPVDIKTGEPTLRLKDRRIKAKKLRGVWSQGMLVPAPAYSKLGDDVAAELGITHYEPPVYSYPDRASGGLSKHHAGDEPWGLVANVYSLESWYRHPNVLVEGEDIVITEKVHGANFRAVFHEGRLYVGSHKLWKDPSYEVIRNMPFTNWLKGLANRFLGTMWAVNETRQNNDWWWTAAREYDLATKLATYPDAVLYGEVYGPQVQDLGYGVSNADLKLVFYDVRDGLTGEWLDFEESEDVITALGLAVVPVLYIGPYNEAVVRHYIDGPSFLSTVKQMREGIVIQTAIERRDPGCGRMKLKAVSSAYLERSTEKEEPIA